MDQTSTAKKIFFGGLISIGIVGILLWVRSKITSTESEENNTQKKRKSKHNDDKKARSDINTSAGDSRVYQKQGQSRRRQASENQLIISRQNSVLSAKSERSDSLYNEDIDSYQNPIKDDYGLEIPIYTSKQYRFKQLSYKILLKMTKGLGYYGVVTINFTMFGFLKKDAVLQFNGSQIYKVSVNGKVIKQQNLKYEKHKIYIFSEHLNVDSNSVQVYFWNKYSFFDDGLSTFFKIQNNRYSLKSQCVYSKSNKYTIARIIPCFNQQTPCKVDVSIIHGQDSIAFSNGAKKSIKSFHETEYPQYKFMHGFDQSKKVTVRSSSKLSSRSFKDTVKNISQFSNTQLSSIENLFVASLPFVQGKVDNEKHSNFRFYSSAAQKHSVVNFGNYVLNFIEDSIARKEFKSPNEKVDFIILNSDSMNGYFSKGVYIFNQKAFNHRSTKSQKVNYLLKRAFLAKFNPPLGVDTTLTLNKSAAKLVPQYINYLRLQQVKFKQIFDLKVSPQYFSCYQQLYTRALKYFCPGLVAEQCVEEILEHLFEGEQSGDQNWKFLLQNFNQFKPSIRQLIIQLIIKYYGNTKDEQIRLRFVEKLKGSPELIYFLKDEQIKEKLKTLMVDNPRRLSLIINRLQLSSEQESVLANSPVAKYIKNKHNIEQCKQLYEGFLEFDEKENFHKLRIKHVLSIKESEKQIECSLVPSVILSRLKIRCSNNDEVVEKMIGILNDIVQFD